MINTTELGIYIPKSGIPKDLEPIGWGADSTVCKKAGENVVVKFYKPAENLLARIGLYQKVTDQAIAYLKEKPRVYQVTIGNKTYEYTVQVTPISKVEQDPNDPNQVIAECPYIEGPSLLDAYPPRAPFTPREFADPVSVQLENLSDELNNQLGVTGILILEPNVKFAYDPQNKIPINLTVTDLSSHIWSLKPTQK